MSFIFVLPFVFLLLSVAIIPVISIHFWEKNYKKIIPFFILVTLLLDFIILKDYISPLISFIEYTQFIIFILVLYIISGGIIIKVNTKGTPLVNSILLFCGSILTNFIGTTGASVLLIKPYMKINKNRLKPYNIVFFIFTVCNVGGCLSPIGDPPLFAGFLKGIPFFWTLKNNFLPWLFTNLLLVGIFYLIDKKNGEKSTYVSTSNKILEVDGKINFVFVILTIISIFINPVIFKNLPTFNIGNHEICFVREILLIIIGILAIKFADKDILKQNNFSLEPISELIVLFLGIFITMGPALLTIEGYSANIDKNMITPTLFYWVVAFFSSFLDNTPTFINSLTLMMSIEGANIYNQSDVLAFSEGLYQNSIKYLKIICITSVFFGGFTYIGNGPNFIIKTIAEKEGINMPTFFTYILKYSCIYLLPVLTLDWYIFCR